MNKKLSALLLLTLSCVFAIQSHASAERVGNFALIDHEGVYHQLQKYGDSKAVVLFRPRPAARRISSAYTSTVCYELHGSVRALVSWQSTLALKTAWIRFA